DVRYTPAVPQTDSRVVKSSAVHRRSSILRSLDRFDRAQPSRKSFERSCVSPILECADLSALLKSGDESPHSKFTHPESCPTSLRRRGALQGSTPRPAETRPSIHKAGMHR